MVKIKDRLNEIQKILEEKEIFNELNDSMAITSMHRIADDLLDSNLAEEITNFLEEKIEEMKDKELPVKGASAE